MATIRRVLVNPERKRKSFNGAKARPKKKTNPGTLSLLGIVNPERKRSNMPQQKNTKRANPSQKAGARPKKKKNPGVQVLVLKKQQHRRRASNPSPLSRGVGFAKSGIAALVGLVITRQIPQMLLKEKNTGVMGYAANVVTAIGTAAAASKIAGKEVAVAVGVGGALYVANRLISEQLSPVGKVLSLSGLGDPLAADRSQLAGIRPAYFASPEVYDRSGNAVIPEAIENRMKAIGAPPAAKMAGVRFAA